ncbi:MAG: transglycosylase SLT domain-containing protein, partial [Dokdonella sp.]
MDVPVSPPTAVSTWERLRQRFVLSGCNDSDTVLKQAQHLTAAPDRFSLAWQQAMPFLQIVVDEIERRGLPGEIALLPYVESRYQQLPGKAGGPAGMWQLMAPTARGHGVHVSATYDGRLDPFESTRAALDLIERLDREFADWRLASMAYNAGEY